MWGLDDDVLSIVQVASEKLVLAVVTYIESASAVFTSVMLFRISSPHLPATAGHLAGLEALLLLDLGEM
jgi:hypothetical protein